MSQYLQQVQIVEAYSLQVYRDFPGLTPVIDEIESLAKLVRKQLKRRKIWMLNSTAQGGGVAEMLPTLVWLFQELKLPVSWLVMQPQEASFFLLTKKIHHLLHGRTDGGEKISRHEKALYTLTSRYVAAELKEIVGKKDLLVIHDPQPLGAGKFLAEEHPEQALLWRCHIGTEHYNIHAQYAWRFLKLFLNPYREVFFTHPDYIPRFLKKKSSLLNPAIDPLSDKNRFLSTEENVAILRMAHLYGGPLQGFIHPAQQLNAKGKLENVQNLDVLTQPTILQVSRWDHLKGFIPLMKGFLHMKRQAKATHYQGLERLTQKMICDSVLVLAGPELDGVADDPEPRLVMEEIRRYYQKLPAKEQQQIFILLLPMRSIKENALIINGLQRTAEVIVQNSIREGFGLTVTEALWKEVPVLTTNVGGIRLQVQDDKTGILIQNPFDAKEVGNKLLYLLTHRRERQNMARRGWLHTMENYLMPVLLRNYLQIFLRHLKT